jgi:hypothetical protein
MFAEQHSLRGSAVHFAKIQNKHIHTCYAHALHFITIALKPLRIGHVGVTFFTQNYLRKHLLKLTPKSMDNCK